MNEVLTRMSYLFNCLLFFFSFCLFEQYSFFYCESNEVYWYLLVRQEKKAWLTALRDIIEAARAGTTPVQALLAERATTDEKGGASRATLRDVEEKMKSIRVTPKSVNPAATKAKAAAARQVRNDTDVFVGFL